MRVGDDDARLYQGRGFAHGRHGSDRLHVCGQHLVLDHALDRAWMHTQLGAGGSSAVGMAAGLRALKRKGKIKDEKINVINFSGDLGAGDMGIGGFPPPCRAIMTC